jgi:hypothetical protein
MEITFVTAVFGTAWLIVLYYCTRPAMKNVKLNSRGKSL